MVIIMKKRTSITILLVIFLLLPMSSSCGYNESQQRIYDAGQEAGKAEFPVQQEVSNLLKNYQGTEESAEEAALLHFFFICD